MLAVIETGGKQYKVEVGKKIVIEKVKDEPSKKIIFDKVLLTADKNGVEIGQPYISDVKIEGEVLKSGRDKKKIVFRYHSKTRYRKKKTHRQNYIEVKISKI